MRQCRGSPAGGAAKTLDALRKLAQTGRSDGTCNSTMRNPNFEAGSRSNWDHESGSDIAPPSEARLVGDAGGRIVSDARTQADHFGSGDVSDGLEVMTVENLNNKMRRRWRSLFF